MAALLSFLTNLYYIKTIIAFFRLSPEFLHVSGPLTWWCASALGAALLCSSWVGSLFGAYSQTWVDMHKIISDVMVISHKYTKKYAVFFEAKSHWIWCDWTLNLSILSHPLRHLSYRALVFIVHLFLLQKKFETQLLLFKFKVKIFPLTF